MGNYFSILTNRKLKKLDERPFLAVCNLLLASANSMATPLKIMILQSQKSSILYLFKIKSFLDFSHYYSLLVFPYILRYWLTIRERGIYLQKYETPFKGDYY